MLVSRLRAVLLPSLLSLLVLPCVASAQQEQQTCATAIPANVDAGLLASEMLALLQRSDTFRSQCERIAARPRLRVQLAITSAVDAGGRAQTTFRRYRAGTLEADVEVLFGENYRELLAHEFEHVIEQIDGVNLRREAAEGRAWQVAGGAFETRRALLAGVQVLREAEAPHAHGAVTAMAATR